MYKKNTPIRFSFIKLTPSSVNAEKVVKPPQKPVIKINLWSLERMVLRSERPQRIPIKKHPATFTVNVPKGNGEGASV